MPFGKGWGKGNYKGTGYKGKGKGKGWGGCTVCIFTLLFISDRLRYPLHQPETTRSYKSEGGMK